MARKKFEVVYVVGKEEVTFPQYQIFLALEEFGVEMITAYRSVRRVRMCRLYRPQNNCCIERQVDRATFISALPDGSIY